MSGLWQLGAVGASLALVLAMMAGVRAASGTFGWSAEVKRKCVHVGTGLYALSFPFLFTDRWPVILLISASVGVLLLLRGRAGRLAGLGAALHSVERKSYGDVLLAIAILILFLRSAHDPVLYALPLAVVTLSDAAAALTGSAYGKRFFALITGAKSVEGTVIFALVTFIIAMVLLLLLTDIARPSVVFLSLLIAAFGALVEAESWRGFDNLFIPLSLHLLLARHLETGATGLVALTLALLATLTIALLLARPLGIRPHTARATAIVLFVIAAVTAPHNILLPAVAFLAQLAARKARPCQSDFPDLDFLSALVCIAIFWLVLGEALGPNALSFYNITFACAALAYGALALARRQAWRWPVLAGGAGGIFALLALINDANLAAKLWLGALWPYAVASFLLAGLMPALFPDLFDRQRALRVALVSVSLPFLFYCAGATLMQPMEEKVSRQDASAVLYRDAPAWNGQRTAAVGQFACASPASGATLLQSAASRLAREGFRAMIGPMDGDTWHSHRLVTASDATPPFLLEPVSGAHDAAAFELAGFSAISSYVSARAPVAAAGEAPVVPAGVTITPWDGRDADRLVAQLFSLSSQAFANNAFYKPVDPAAFRAMYAPLIPKLDPRLVLFAFDARGELAGFLFGYPDHLQGARPTAAVLKTYASRQPGAGRALASHFHCAVRELGYAHVIHALMHADNSSRARSSKHAGTVFRRYALMGLRLDAVAQS